MAAWTVVKLPAVLSLDTMMVFLERCDFIDPSSNTRQNKYQLRRIDESIE